MILSKFQVDSTSLTNFGYFLNIGKNQDLSNFRRILVYKKCLQTAKNDVSNNLFGLFFKHKMTPKKGCEQNLERGPSTTYP